MLLTDCIGVLAQTNTSQVLDIQTFRFRDGLDVGFIQSLEFDNEGWLWISGLESESGSNDYLNKGMNVQRFDGLSFHSVTLPDVAEKSFVGCHLFKRNDGWFYLFYDGVAKDYLFLLDPLTQSFTSVPLPEANNVTKIAGVFPTEDVTYVAVDYGVNTELFELDRELTFTRLFSIERERAGESYINDIFRFKDHFLISEERIGIYAAKPDGTKIRSFTYQNLGIPLPVPYEPLVIRDNYLLNGKHYFGFREERELFIYEPEKIDFTRIKHDGTHPDVTRDENNPGYFRSVLTDGHNNFVTIRYSEKGAVFSRYLESDSYYAKELEAGTVDARSMASRNLNKELFVGELGRLRHITFRDSQVKTFLVDYSIRFIMHLQENEYLVATEYKGWHIVNTANGTQRPIQLTADGKPFTATETRGMYRDKYGIWSNYNAGFMLVDPETFEVELFREFPIRAMANTEDKIYFGSYKYPLSYFDKKSKSYHKISKNDSLIATDIQIVDNTVYMTTDQGLLKYKEGEEAVFVGFELDEGGFMMLEEHDSLKILVTTTLGDVYQFDPETEVYQKIYQRKANNPIASIFTTDDGKLWMNTFAGVISLDLKTGKTERFLEEDGLSNNEGNRYSELKTADGSFLFGTIKGLNFFHPDQISKAPLNAELKITSLTRYSRDVKANVTEANRQNLDKVKEVTLPAESRYLKMEIAPAGLISNLNTNIQYRLNKGDWQTLYNAGTIELINLAAGSYKLEMRLVSTDLSPLGRPFVVTIHAQEFFYKTAWFISLVLLLVTAVSYYLIRQANRAKELEQGYSRSLLRVQEGERQRISRELHDSVGQQLILLKNQAKAQQNEEMSRTASETLEEVRTITRDLHPVVLKQLGLTAALEELVHKLDQHSEIFFSTELANVDGVLDESEELNLYRIVQEALNNIVKHSQALSTRMTLERVKSKLVLIIQDNGQGFYVDEQAKASTSLGLKTLQERARMLKAGLVINSSEKGTEIILEIQR